MLGDIVGLDGIGTDRHGCQAVALEDTEVCVLPVRAARGPRARACRALQHNLHRSCRARSRATTASCCCSAACAPRSASRSFLLNLAERYRRRGYSSTEFVLRMTREEIGSYLGLKLETVSRLFSRFQEEGLIQVQGRAVKLLDLAALKQLVGQRADRATRALAASAAHAVRIAAHCAPSSRFGHPAGRAGGSIGQRFTSHGERSRNTRERRRRDAEPPEAEEAHRVDRLARQLERRAEEVQVERVEHREEDRLGDAGDQECRPDHPHEPLREAAVVASRLLDSALARAVAIASRHRAALDATLGRAATSAAGSRQASVSTTTSQRPGGGGADAPDVGAVGAARQRRRAGPGRRASDARASAVTRRRRRDASRRPRQRARARRPSASTSQRSRRSPSASRARGRARAAWLISEPALVVVVGDHAVVAVDRRATRWRTPRRRRSPGPAISSHGQRSRYQGVRGGTVGGHGCGSLRVTAQRGKRNVDFSRRATLGVVDGVDRRTRCGCAPGVAGVAPAPAAAAARARATRRRARPAARRRRP